jgi:hypothetical protein
MQGIHCFRGSHYNLHYEIIKVASVYYLYSYSALAFGTASHDTFKARCSKFVNFLFYCFPFFIKLSGFSVQ